jgi:hypothetical protein
MDKPYSVNHWGSHPDEENDDCHTGEDFDSLDEALKAYHTNPSDRSVAWIEIDGLEDSELKKLGISRCRKNPKHRKTRDDDSDWKREQAMQAGMAFGCDGYNEAMGWD